MEIVVSGIRPTGNLHLGNYFGALKNFISMQNEHDCYFFIADYHSLTTHPTPQDLHGNVKQVLVEYLAAGLDPEKATLYVQSDVPETAELYLFLNMNAYMGELERCTSFKDKIRQQPQNVNAGLLTYPTLMAADIIIHKATCENAIRLMSQKGNLIVPTKWTSVKMLAYLARIHVSGIDRLGIASDLTNTISKELNVNIRSLNIDAHDGIFEGVFDLYVHNTQDINSLLFNLSRIKGVDSVKRVEKMEEN